MTTKEFNRLNDSENEIKEIVINDTITTNEFSIKRDLIETKNGNFYKYVLITLLNFEIKPIIKLKIAYSNDLHIELNQHLIEQNYNFIKIYN